MINWVYMVFLLLVGVYSVQSLLISPLRSIIPCSQLRLSSRYIPPELDPEYFPKSKSGVVAKETTIVSNVDEASVGSNSEEYLYPEPKEGDIVQFPGKWGEKLLGRIRFLRYVESYGSFRAEVIPMKDGKSDKIFIVENAAKPYYLNLDSTVQPVRAMFMRKENGYKISYNKTTPSEVALKAARYRKLDKTFTPIRKVSYKVITSKVYSTVFYVLTSQAVNYSILKEDFQNYNELKRR